MGKKEKEIGDFRQKIVRDLLTAIHSDKPDIAVYTISVTNNIEDYQPKEQGYTIVSRPERKAPDILVFKDGILKSAWEITNYSIDSYFGYPRFMKYVNNLTKFDCGRVFVVSYPENFRLIYEDRTPEDNIEYVERVLATNKIMLIYWECQHIPKEKEEAVCCMGRVKLLY